MRICQVCGKTIEKSSKAKKYCSPECRAKVKYLKDRAWLAEHPEKSKEYARNWYAKNAEACKRAKNEEYRQKCIQKFQKETV